MDNKEQELIAKVDHTFIMVLSGIMMQNVEKFRHKVSDELFERLERKVLELKANNERQMYDELNVKSTIIDSYEEDKENDIANITVISRYMDYVIDATTGKYKRGVNDHRVEKANHLVFKKKKSATYDGVAKTCSGCGRNLDVNKTGVCSYCGHTYEGEEHDWILTEIEIFEAK